MTKLVLLGGPPGVGKSTVITSLREQQLTCLEADEISPPGTHVETSDAIAKVIQATERACKSSPIVFLSWVFAREELYKPFSNHFAHAPIVQLYLVCEPHMLKLRLAERGDTALVTYALERLHLINQLAFEKIDTSQMGVAEVAQTIMKKI